MPGHSTPEAYDLLLWDPDAPDQPIGLMLVRDPRRPTAIEEVFEPTELGSVSPPRPVPVIWDRWDGGAGVARPVPDVRGAYKLGRNACTRFGAVTPAGGLHEVNVEGLGLTQVYKMHPYGTDIMLTAGNNNRVYMLNYGLQPLLVRAIMSPFSSLQDMVVFGGSLYITGGSQGLVKYDGTNFSEGTSGPNLSRMTAVTWTRGGVPRRRLVGTNATGTAFLYTTGDNPLDPNHWSSPIPIEAAWPIQQLVAAPRHVYAVGPGGVFDLTENGETPCITGETWAKNYHPENGQAAILYDGSIYVETLFGVFAISLEGRLVEVMEDVTIGHLQPAELPTGGYQTVLGQVDGWLYQLTWNRKERLTQLWYGMRRERLRASTPWPIIWYGSECTIPNQRVLASAVVAPPGQPRRMWIATLDLTTNAVRLWWHDLPRYGSPLQDYQYGDELDRMRYARDWDIIQTEETLGDAASTKTPLWWDITARNLGGPNRLTVSAAGRDGTFVEQGTATTNDFRAGASAVSDKGLVVKVTGANSELVPAVLDAVKGSWVVTVEESVTTILPVIYGRGVSLLNGAEDLQDADVTFSALAQLSRHASVQAVRWNGDVLTVRVEQGVRRRWIESPDRDGWLEGAVVPITILARPMRHDVGDRHDVALRHDG